MAQQPIAMEQVKQIFQLNEQGVSIREIVRRTGISRNSVRKYLNRLKLVEHSADKDLASCAYNSDIAELEAERLALLTAHFKASSSELSKTGVTRQLLWQEYLAEHPNDYSYSRYCHHLEQYLKNRDISMHLEYDPGDMIMIDFAGKTLHYVDAATGEQIDCQVFVAVLPFSGLIFCEAVHTQQTADFTHLINSMLKFYGGVPATILCDNLKTAVKRCDRYEPDFTDICVQLGEHYATTFSATRPYSPRDKAMVEKAVNIVYRHIYAPLRNHHFTGIEPLNTAIHQQLILLNEKPYKNTPYSRRYFFDQKEQGFLKQLPAAPFAAKKVVQLTVQRNYHVQLTEDRRYYSVPYQYVGKKVKVLYDNQNVEIYFEHGRIAFHPRKKHNSSYTTLAEHMPPHHQRMHQIKGFNREDLLKQAGYIGEATVKAATLILENSIYMEQNYKSCFGMLMLKNKFGTARLEAACERALLGSRINYTMIKTILEKGMDKQAYLFNNQQPPIPQHDNIRGKDYYK